MIVTLLTDYGNRDTYVGQFKGSILSVEPTVTLIDLTHHVPPQDVVTGAFHLWAAVESFPPGTLHVAVVDPGVGTQRKAVAIRTRRGDTLIGPDNGLLAPACDRIGGAVAQVELSRREFWGTRQSATFHGRDIFGPVAGHLARGAKLEELGDPLKEHDQSLKLAPPTRDGAHLRGEVMVVDTFGNLVTNLPADSLPRAFNVHVAGRRITNAPHPHYSAVAKGSLLAVVGSYGLLEICARNDSAANILAVGRGDVLAIEPVG